MPRPSILPEWATTGTKIEPSAAKKATGWVFKEKPPYEWFNWLLNLIYLWVEWLDEQATRNEENINKFVTGSQFIDGLQTERTTATSLTVNPGVCIDDGKSTIIELTGQITKIVNTTFVQGDGNGALAPGAIWAADTWYYVFLVTDDVDVDIVIDDNPDGTQVPGAWTTKRRIWTIYSNSSSEIEPYTQVGDTFTWGVALDRNEFVNATASTVYTSENFFPPGIEIEAVLSASAITANTVDIRANIFCDGYSNNQTPSTLLYDIRRLTSGTENCLRQKIVRTDDAETLSTGRALVQFDAVDAPATMFVRSSGFTDYRGKNGLK